ncbi:hypothetical protein [Azospirillum oryzae]|nr:hypothetical protein [Azospirillum oryzae]
MIRVNPRISLDESELQEEFIRASGPGGQHVNMFWPISPFPRRGPA